MPIQFSYDDGETVTVTFGAGDVGFGVNYAGGDYQATGLTLVPVRPGEVGRDLKNEDSIYPLDPQGFLIIPERVPVVRLEFGNPRAIDTMVECLLHLRNVMDSD
jgi:hypothetical protein